MAESTSSGDDRAAQGLAHLQSAARELIAAARAMLDVAEELVEDPKTAGLVTDAIGAVVRSAVRAGRPDPGTAGDGPTEGTGVERIEIT